MPTKENMTPETQIAKLQGNDIRSLMASDSVKKQIALALPRHMSPDRMSRVMLTAMTQNPKLLDCTKESLLQCLMTLSQIGLEPDKRNAHLIPFEDKKKGITVCTLIVDYKGLVTLVRRSGEVSDIHADVICEGDEFEYSFGSGSKLTHKPALKDRGDAKGFYSYVRLKDGSESFEVLSLDEVLSVRDRSQGYQAFEKGFTKTNPWDSDFREMGKKTAFKRHSKWLPLSSEVIDAIDKDEEHNSFETAINITPPAMPPKVEKPKAEVKSEPVETAQESEMINTKGEFNQSEGINVIDDGALSDFEKLQIMCQENGVKTENVVGALKRLGKLPTRTTITTDKLTDQQLGWCVVSENFEQILKNIEA